MDQAHAMAPPVKGGQEDFLSKAAIALGIEVFGLVPAGKLSVRQGHRPENLLGIALAAGGDLRLGVHPSPGLVQGRAWAEGRLVLVNDYAPFALGFFLRLG